MEASNNVSRRSISEEGADRVDHLEIVINNEHNFPLVEIRAWVRDSASDKIAYIEGIAV